MLKGLSAPEIFIEKLESPRFDFLLWKAHLFLNFQTMQTGNLANIFPTEEYENISLKDLLSFERDDFEDSTPLLNGWVSYLHNGMIILLIWTTYKVQTAVYKVFQKMGPRHINSIIVPILVSFCFILSAWSKVSFDILEASLSRLVQERQTPLRHVSFFTESSLRGW